MAVSASTEGDAHARPVFSTSLAAGGDQVLVATSPRTSLRRRSLAQQRDVVGTVLFGIAARAAWRGMPSASEQWQSGVGRILVDRPSRQLRVQRFVARRVIRRRIENGGLCSAGAERRVLLWLPCG